MKMTTRADLKQVTNWAVGWMIGNFPARVGSVLNFPVELSASAVVLITVVGIADGMLAVGRLISLFALVFLHELGHALAARRLGLEVTSIQLHILGGFAKIEDLQGDPKKELWIALAGPTVSLALATVGLIAWVSCRVAGFAWFFGINMTIAVFNLVPALPMDGGRVLRALLVPRLGLQRATRTAVQVTRIIVLIMCAVGLWEYHGLLFLAPVIWIMGERELTIARRAA